MFAKLAHDLIDHLLLKEAEGLAGLSMGGPQVAQPMMRTGGAGAPAGGIKPPAPVAGGMNLSMGAPKPAQTAGIRGAGGIAPPAANPAGNMSQTAIAQRQEGLKSKTKSFVSNMFGGMSPGGLASRLGASPPTQVASRPGGGMGSGGV